jgi:hypothetical protein
MNILRTRRSPSEMKTLFHAWRLPAAWILGLLCLAGCARAQALQPSKSLPPSDAVAGWSLSDTVRTYDRETLFDYIDGSSEYYLTYTFEEVAAARYENSAGNRLTIEVWRFAEPQDAYGLFSGRTGGKALSVGGANEASLETGSRLRFWQERFFVTLTAYESVADEDLLQFAAFISKALPTGGEPPPILDRLPRDGLIPDSVKFFHQELAIQDRLWLGGENLLGLDPDTDAVLARYQTGDAEWDLLLVEYPDPLQANAGWEALTGGGMEDLAAADVNGEILGAVIGQGETAQAVDLLGQALGK